MPMRISSVRGNQTTRHSTPTVVCEVTHRAPIRKINAGLKPASTHRTILEFEPLAIPPSRRRHKLRERRDNQGIERHAFLGSNLAQSLHDRIRNLDSRFHMDERHGSPIHEASRSPRDFKNWGFRLRRCSVHPRSRRLSVGHFRVQIDYEANHRSTPVLKSILTLNPLRMMHTRSEDLMVHAWDTATQKLRSVRTPPLTPCCHPHPRRP